VLSGMRIIITYKKFLDVVVEKNEDCVYIEIIRIKVCSRIGQNTNFLRDSTKGNQFDWTHLKKGCLQRKVIEGNSEGKR